MGHRREVDFKWRADLRIRPDWIPHFPGQYERPSTNQLSGSTFPSVQTDSFVITIRTQLHMQPIHLESMLDQYVYRGWQTYRHDVLPGPTNKDRLASGGSCLEARENRMCRPAKCHPAKIDGHGAFAIAVIVDPNKSVDGKNAVIWVFPFNQKNTKD